VVDASQGVEAQTLANVYQAIDNNHEIVPVLNKIDLPAAEPERIRQQIEDVIGLDASDAILTSAKTGDDQRDASLPASDWFDAATHPKAVFTATKFEKKGDGAYVAHGTLDLRGVSKPVDLPFKLKIVGDGALRPELEAIARSQNLNIEFLGMQKRPMVMDAISGADLLIVPSEVYEGFPLVIAESFACGTPVLASRIGSLEELVEEGVNGRKFAAADPEELAGAVRVMLADKPALHRMRANARAYFDAHLTEQANYAQLMNIYSAVIAEPRRRSQQGSLL